MDLNSVSSNKVVLNIRTPQGGEVPLNKGEVLQTQVKDVGEDGLVTIVVKGKLIEAATEVPVKPGQQLLLMVDDVRNGKTYLKVVTPEMMGKIENTNISAHLLDMGIAAKEDAILLSRKLLQYNLPVNQSNLNELNKNITQLGGMNARNMEIAAFALSRGIAGKTALESLAQFLAPQTDVVKLIPVLGSILEALAASKPGQAGESSVAASQLPSQAGENGPTALQAQNPAGKNVGPAVSTSQSFPGQSSEIKGQQRPFPTTNDAPARVSMSNIKETGDGLAARNVTTSSNKVAELLAEFPKTTNNNLDRATAQPHLIISSAEGEEINSGSKLPPSASRSSSSAQFQPNQTTGLAGDKAPNDQIKTDVNNVRTAIANAGVWNEKSVRPGPATPIPNSEPTNTGQESLQQDKPLKSSSNEVSARNTVSVPNPKAGEAMSGVQVDKANIPKPESNVIPVPMATSLNDEGMVSAKGLETAWSLPGGGSEAAYPQDSLSRNISNLLDTLRSLLEINPEDPPDKIAGKIQEAVLSEKDIIKALTLLKEIVDSKDISEKLPQLKDFSLRLNSLEKEITGQQLFNISNKNSVDNISSFYFSFPVPIDQGYSICQLKISKDGHQRLRDVDKLSFVVSLNTAKLGVVLFHVQWQKAGQLELQGVVENQASCNYLNQNTDQLVKSLEALGYRVKHQGVKVSSSSEEIRSLKPVLQEVTEPLRPLGIDVTV